MDYPFMSKTFSLAHPMVHFEYGGFTNNPRTFLTLYCTSQLQTIIPVDDLHCSCLLNDLMLFSNIIFGLPIRLLFKIKIKIIIRYHL